MDNTELNKIVAAWITGEEAEDGTPEREAKWWAIEQVMDWSLEGEGELLWQFILTVYNGDISQKVAALLAAGPLEDLLAYHGPKFIVRVEQLAQKDDKFNWLLGGVWRNDMTDEVWQRVQAARKKFGNAQSNNSFNRSANSVAFIRETCFDSAFVAAADGGRCAFLVCEAEILTMIQC